MQAHKSTASLSAFAIALALLLPAAARAAEKPDFSGTWEFVPPKSDDVKTKVLSALGSSYTIGNDKSEQSRVWIRTWLMGFAESPEKRVLTIEQHADRFQAGLGDEVNNYYFGREAAGTGPGGGRVKATVAWQGDQVVAEERQVKGKGRMRATYALLPGGSLQVDWHLEHEAFDTPLDVRLVFNRSGK